MGQLKVVSTGIVAALFLVACSSTVRRAPIVDRTIAAPRVAVKPVAKTQDWRPKSYVVQKGDTLYSIALEHGLDYKELAEWNGITNADMIRVGQSLRLTSSEAPAAKSEAEPVTQPLKIAPSIDGGKPLAACPPAGCSPATAITPAPNSATTKSQPLALRLPYSEQALAQLQRLPEQPEKAESKPETGKVDSARPDAAAKPELPADAEGAIDWGWPAVGKMVSGFSENANLKGIDIAGKAGQPVLASAPGKVVYTGSGLRGYGKLIIIKHNKSYLSAYAHNSQILVKEGQSVVKGEKIAEMGDSDADQVMLHFEIRYLGKPVDPLRYLKQ